MAITARGTIASTSASVSGTTETITINSTSWAVGDIVWLYSSKSSTTIKINSITGGGADGTGWQLVNSITGTANTAFVTCWWAKLGSIGSLTATLTWSATPGTPMVAWQGFTAGLGASTVWTVVDAKSLTNSTASTTITMPTCTATGAGQLYMGVGASGISATSTGAGSATGGWTWQTDAFADRFAYNLSTAAGSFVAPNPTQAPSTQSNSAATLFSAAAPAAGAPTGNFFPFMHHEPERPQELWTPPRGLHLPPGRRPALDGTVRALSAREETPCLAR